MKLLLYRWRFVDRVWLFVRIVYRVNQAEYRTPPALAWEITDGICAKEDYV